MTTMEEEMVDVVDLSDSIIGALPRGLLKGAAANYRVVHVFVLNRRGELLLQKLAPGKGDGVAEWGSSVAGHVQSGESYEIAARREFREELGVRLQHMTEIGKTWLDSDGRRKFIGVYFARAEGPFRADPAEAVRLDFVSPVAIRKWMQTSPSSFTSTFHRVFPMVEAELRRQGDVAWEDA